jgi:triosephosphate isomerase
MNLTSTETSVYLASLRARTASLEGVDLFVLPPFTSVWVARAMLDGTHISWGAQDVHPEESGPHTGDVAARMLADLGCRFVECGHSERRRDHGETDVIIARKVRQIVRHGMTPILCVGEPSQGGLEEAAAYVTSQLVADLALLDPAGVASLVIAYEPVWAIGVGAAAADPAHVASMHAAIRSAAERHLGGRGTMRVIYGGSVDPTTARRLLEADGVDGLFVGRSALDPDNLAAIASTAQEVAATTVRHEPATTTRAGGARP